ncbi:DUF3150 domain-containing protein [Acidithiobacillus thiooxidans]|uniref:DUF3150 domain-containing protein n=1 Tax=Acidithiobacillus thiooxidans TaxID=930 RepID=A0A1C2IPG5_ACITH|nr:DUF3150 domain-containing protein [Acidithiobacillus thiooxidans]OCX69885.1 hypothetical protein A6M23_14690 [Acidithiobacillus thiooxidans]OCX77911.1 hypothetical protein A6P08_20535 [Acidithiobacillus thiooxidans]
MKGIVFLPEMNMVSGTRKLDRGLIEAKDGRDLDLVMASAGTIQVLPKEALRPFGAARKAVEVALLSKGTRFFGGYLVDEVLAADVHASLAKIKEDFEKAKLRLSANLSGYIDDRCKEVPEWEDIIRNSAPSVEDINQGIGFSWIKTPIDLSDPEVEEVLQGDPLAIRIAREMAQIANGWLQKGRNGKGLPGLPVLSQLKSKAKALSFIDGRLGGVVTALDTVIQDANAARGTPVQAGAVLVVRGVLQAMTSPATILQVGDDGDIAGLGLPEMDEPVVPEVPEAVAQESESFSDSELDDDAVVEPQRRPAPAPAPVVPVSQWAF